MGEPVSAAGEPAPGNCPGPGVQQPGEVLQAALASDLELAVEEIEALSSASGSSPR